MKAELKPKPAAAVSDAAPDPLARENARLRGDLMTVARRISHDLRTPLGGVIVATEMLKEVLGDTAPERTSLLSPILDSTEEIKKILERVSFVLKASANPSAKQRVKMGEVVFRELQRLESRALKKNATVSQPASWPEVDGVFAWLEVVWWNLLANGLQHGRNRIELGWEQTDGELLFWVCDDGPGVPAEKRDKLFQPFETLHQPDAGHGLGLAIVRRLVELQGGDCGYEPRPESGSRFYFTLPVMH